MIKWRTDGDTLTADCFVEATPWKLDVSDAEAEALAKAQRVERTSHPEELYRLAIEHLDRYVAAVNRQTELWSRWARAELEKACKEKQGLFKDGLESLNRVEELLAAWRTPPLRLEVRKPVEPREGSPSSSVQEAKISLPPRLSDTSLERHREGN